MYIWENSFYFKHKNIYFCPIKNVIKLYKIIKKIKKISLLKNIIIFETNNISDFKNYENYEQEEYYYSKILEINNIHNTYKSLSIEWNIIDIPVPKNFIEHRIYNIKIYYHDNQIIIKFNINDISLIPWIIERKILINEELEYIIINNHIINKYSSYFINILIEKSKEENIITMKYKKSIMQYTNIVLYTKDKNTYGDDNIKKTVYFK